MRTKEILWCMKPQEVFQKINIFLNKEEKKKQNHLFYIKSIHEDGQDLSNLNDNDYLKFFHNHHPDPKKDLKNLLWNSAQTLSFKSSIEMTDLALETYNYNYSSQWKTSEEGYDPFTDNIEGNMLTTFIVKDTSQASLTERDVEKQNNSPLKKENLMLKAKIAFQNKVIEILKEKASSLSMMKEMRENLQLTTEENGLNILNN